MAGGCWVLAQALKEHLGPRAELWAVAQPWGRPEHVVVRVGNKYIDADGVHSLGTLLNKMRRVERMSRPELIPFKPADATSYGIACPTEAVARVRRALQRALPDPRFDGAASSRSGLGAVALIYGIGAAATALAIGLKRGVVGLDGPHEDERLKRLQPHIRARVLELQRRLRARGVRTFIGTTRRTTTEQAEALATGRSTTPRSWHLIGRAVDLYVIDPATGQPDTMAQRLDLYKILWEEAKRLGAVVFTKPIRLKSGKKLFDAAHVYWTDGLTWKAAVTEAAQKGRRIV